MSDPGQRQTKPRRRRKPIRLVKPQLQWKFVACALCASVGTALVQFAALNALLSDLFIFGNLEVSRADLLDRVWNSSLLGLAIAVLFMVPVVSLFMVLVTMRLAGPVYRMEQDLAEIAAGSPPRAIHIRKGDELQELCDILNRALETTSGADNPEHEATKPELDTECTPSNA